MPQIILATNNPGKVLELQAILAPIRGVSQSSLNIPAVDETGATFVENAILKARHVSQIANAPALADDSGLVVPALQGRPGIHSARFAGERASDIDNIQKLLAELSDVPMEQRDACFYCAIVMLRHPNDPSPLIATGYCDGQISLHPQGKGGFGYDPVFYLPEYGCTFAELSLDVKNTISHRAKAMIQLKQQLSDNLSFFL